jgi:hypothetical protein
MRTNTIKSAWWVQVYIENTNLAMLLYQCNTMLGVQIFIFQSIRGYKPKNEKHNKISMSLPHGKKCESPSDKRRGSSRQNAGYPPLINFLQCERGHHSYYTSNERKYHEKSRCEVADWKIYREYPSWRCDSWHCSLYTIIN